MRMAIPFIPRCPRASIVPGRGSKFRRAGDRLAGRGHPREYQLDLAFCQPELCQTQLCQAKPAEPQETAREHSAVAPTKATFTAEADRIAAELARYAIRRGPSVAWIGLDWLGDAEVSQLVCLGPDLYNGICGIGVFLAAHAAVTGSTASAELACAGLAQLRKNLKSRNAARMARALGIGGAVGLGSIVYALAVMAKSLHDDTLLADAQQAAELFTDDLIAADKQLDAVSGSAGAILGLLRLYRDTRSDDVLRRAVKCGEHLLGQPRLGPEGRRTWVGQGSGPRGLNGMSHGAAGFAYALTSLAQATGRQELRQRSRKPPPNALPLKIRATTPSSIIGPICARTAGCHGRASGVTAPPVSVWRGLPQQNSAGWMTRAWRPISKTPSKA